MEVPPMVKKKSAKKNIYDEPTWCEHRLERDMHYKMRLLKAMKPFMDTFEISHGA
ncbi:hypothetical protein PVK06_043829 [Gossypium arboreum]|uniref:Uncharacterized protein n=1 Tax=Gossypium arboreum TaxID=29729 RepID=A0ABR0MPW6_GOSAR|nr:hypothetical protein PVK06_043829 [Gossypium arboreum]